MIDVPTTGFRVYHRSALENGNNEVYYAPTPYPAPCGRTGALAEDMVKVQILMRLVKMKLR